MRSLPAGVALATALLLSLPHATDAGTAPPFLVEEELTVTETLFDWDGAGEDVDTLVTNGGQLTINADSIDADNTHNRTIELQGGTTAASGAFLQTNIAQGWTLAGDMQIVGTLGTSGSTASFLNGSADTFTIAPTGVVALDGGSIASQAGGMIINDGVIEGSGLLGGDGFSNNGTLRAVAGNNSATLRTALLQNIDLDGSSTAAPGNLEAVEGDLIVQGRLLDNFGGVVTVGSGQKIDFQLGWTLGSPATLNLVGGAEAATIDSSGVDAGGMNQQNGVTNLRGTVNVINKGRLLGDTVVRSGTTINLADNFGSLEFGGNTEVQAGVSFLPNGEVINLPDSTMTTEDGTDFGSVTLVNDGLLDIDGDLNGVHFAQRTTGEVLLEVGGTSEAEYEQLLFDNFNQLGGTLALEFTGGFVAADGDAFSVLVGDVGTAQFDTVELPELTEGLSWYVDYLAGSLVVSVEADDPGSLVGDYNNDGVVNAIDYTVWRDTLGSTTELGADGDGDGTIDQDDYDLWTANYGDETLAPSAVPEPTGLLAVCGLAAWALTHEKRQRRS